MPARTDKKWYPAREPKARPASTRLGPDTEQANAAVKRSHGNVYLEDLNITGVPDLPANTSHLTIARCPIRRITRLPDTLISLTLLECPNLEDLPLIPANCGVIIRDCPMLPVQYDYQETVDIYGFNYFSNYAQANEDFHAAWAAYKEEERKKKEAKAFCYRIREELIMAVMHPRRIEALIDAVGLDAFDEIYGQQGGFHHLVHTRRRRDVPPPTA